MSSIGKSIVSLTAKNPAFSAAGQAMGELVVAGCIGATCVEKQYLTANIVKALSRTTYTILLPMFLGTTMMKSNRGLTKSSMVLPFMAISQSLILYVLSTTLLLPLFGIDPETDTGKTAAITISFGNAGVLPFMFAEALFRSDAEMLQKAFSRISFFSIGWSPFFWSFGRDVLVGSPTSNAGESSFIQNLKRLVSPPVLGIMLGFLISLSPLSPLLLSTNADKKAPLAVIYNSFQTFGRAANPLGLLVLTASLAMGAKKRSSAKKQAISSDSSSMNKSVGFLQKWACVSVARFIISPLLMLGMLHGLSKLNMIGSQNVEPMLWFILLLEAAMPPAQNSVLLLQVANRAQEAEEMAVFLFSIYATAMIPVVLILTVSLQKLGLA